MTATIFHSGFKEDRWARMIALSFLFHLMIFSTVLFIPQTKIHFPSMEERVYHVELVGPPPGVESEVKGTGVESGIKGRGTASIAKRKETSHILRAKTRRIGIGKKRSAPILAKRVSPKPKDAYRDEAPPASGLIDRAISKIERKVKEEKATQPGKILDKFARDSNISIKKENTGMFGKPSGQPEKTLDKFARDSKIPIKGESTGVFGMSSGIGKGIQLYQLEIEDAIKNNWSYPVALINVKRKKAPEAIIIVTVRSDGKILKTWFKRRSNNPLFDDSVLKAIERSDPLPRFPPGYLKSYDEIEINFSLKDLFQ